MIIFITVDEIAFPCLYTNQLQPGVTLAHFGEVGKASQEDAIVVSCGRIADSTP
jgi:hypothetical protein